MKLPKRSIVVALGLATALTVPAVPAGAFPGDGGPAESKGRVSSSNGQKARVLKLVRDYFVARDKGWLNPQASRAALTGLEADGGAVAHQPTRFAAGLAAIADEAAEETGLQAKKVRTGLTRDTRIKLRGHSATVTVTSGTAITWNDDALGESGLNDTYTVKLEREKQTWRITDVAYAPIPSTEAGTQADVGNAQRLPGADAAADPAAGEVRPMAEGTYDRADAAAYADEWSEQSWQKITLPDGPEWILEEPYNPEYEAQDNNCANFVSQALHAGGWPKAGGVNPDDDENWTDNLWGPYGPSTTWSVAYRLWTYAIDDRRGERLRTWPPADPTGDNQDVWTLRAGDLIFADWDPDGVADGRIDHAMIVTGSYTSQGFTEPTYSQNTPFRNNLPLSIGMKIATAEPPDVDPGDGMGGQGRTAVYYPVRIKDTFTTD